MEGVWFAFDADRAPVPRAREGDRPRRAPTAAPGRARDRLPVLARRPQLLARFVRPDDELRLQRRCGDGRRAVQQKLTPTQKKRKLLLGDVYLGLENGNFGGALCRLARPRLDQRDRRLERQARLEVHDARARARRRDDHRERARLRGGRRRRAARLRSTKTGKVLWTFKTGNRSRPGRRSSAAGGKEYVAVTVGGTPTSSNGGNASQLQVFTLGARGSAPPQDRRRASGRRPPRARLASTGMTRRVAPVPVTAALAATGWAALGSRRQRRRRPARALASRRARTKSRPSPGVSSLCEEACRGRAWSRSTATGCPARTDAAG